MSRVQLALNVSDLDAAIAFYSKLFDTAPAKVRPGYANFAIAEPPLKLVLVEGQGAPGSLNHLGVEVESTDLVASATGRLAGAGLATATEDEVACCYAVQDKVWLDAPDGEPWEIYTVLADVEMTAGQLRTVDPDADTDAQTDVQTDAQNDVMCCATAPESAARCCG
jgi:predicted enzyme related to lactoylglutathione lyase